jgi:hypothetical protein
MSLRRDRVLSQAWRYAQHLRAATTRAELVRSAGAYQAYGVQSDDATRTRMNHVYAAAVAGPLFEDRRRTGRQA